MKKYLTNIPLLFGLTVGFFLISSIDTWFLGATDFSNMYWWSKTALLLSGLSLLTALVNVFGGFFKK